MRGDMVRWGGLVMCWYPGVVVEEEGPWARLDLARPDGIRRDIPCHL